MNNVVKQFKEIRKAQQGLKIAPQIPKYQLAPGPLPKLSSTTPWTAEYQAQQDAEEQAYQQHINQPYYRTHSKPTKKQWKQQIQQARRRQGTVKTAEQTSAPVNAVNQYVRQFKYDYANDRIPKGKYTLPAAALAATGIAGFAVAPVISSVSTAGGYLGGKAVDTGTKFATGKSWADKVHDWTGLDKEAATMTNPGMWIGGGLGYKWGYNTGRRAVETALRTSSDEDGLTNVVKGIRYLRNNKDYDKAKAVSKYILTGRKTGNKGYYNSLSKGPDTYYGGFGENNYNGNDIIDAFLYGKEVDPRYGLTLKTQGSDFGIHSDYVAKNYAPKSKKIQVYETEPNNIYDDITITGTKGRNGSIKTTTGNLYDAGGHREILGVDSNGNNFSMRQDIWKFNPKEYMTRWEPEHAHRWLKPLYKYGLNTVDYYSTPVIVRTPWSPVISRKPSRINLTK